MRVVARILAALALLLSTAVLLLALAGGVGVWLVKGPATEKATWIFERVEAKLEFAEQGLGAVKKSLDRAAERLNTVREGQRTIPRASNDWLRQSLASAVQRMMAPELDAHEKLHKVAEAAVVVNSVLEDVGAFSSLSIPGLDNSLLDTISSNLTTVESTAWELSRLFAEPKDNSVAAGARVSQIEQTIKTVQGLIADYEPLVRQVRQQTKQLKTKVFFWITPAAIVVSVVCFWIVLAQVSLMVHLWSWCMRSAGNNPSATPK
jgi:hypothetical protein